MNYPWYIQLLLTLGSSLIVALFVAVITVRLSLRRFYTERWWERKADAYSRIVEALHNHRNYGEQKLHIELSGQSNETKEDELKKQWEDANKELAKAVDFGSFIISEDAERIIEKFRKRKLPDFEYEPLSEIIESDLKHVLQCLADLKQEAKKDLKLIKLGENRTRKK